MMIVCGTVKGDSAQQSPLDIGDLAKLKQPGIEWKWNEFIIHFYHAI